ncbi:Release factor glutamine methyltransferase [Methanosarcinaceae archaeon Ag5]|uniref:Release factor glutamine methyltransferase n=1 Tax=Methanolapillus africanus TaxID=3028297 RepID=A0AAE4MIP0_9EURY|nr:Release factor glutamine methyltransferase [Methanosarcinaceae archaeon Ag5]
MKLRKLEMELEKVEGFAAPSPALEQYKTPATLAASFLHLAFMSGDIEDQTVYDFGCGTGILSVGAALLGARKVVGFDIDESAVAVAEKNAEAMGVSDRVSFIQCNISDVSEQILSEKLGRADTVVMNPPFGAQEKGNDRPFLASAIQAADVVYSIHNKGSRAFIEKFIKPATITDCFKTEFPIRKTFDFHRKEIETIDVEIYRIETSGIGPD